MLGYLNFEIVGYPVGGVLFFWTFSAWGPPLVGILAGWLNSNARLAHGWLAGFLVSVPALGVHGLLIAGISYGLGFIPLPYWIIEHYDKLFYMVTFGVPAVAMALSVYLCLRISTRTQ